jgi:hypothetical protein
MMKLARMAGVAGVLMTLSAVAAPLEQLEGDDRTIVAEFLKHVERLPQRITAEHVQQLVADEAEGVTWRILPEAAMPLTAYELTEDAKYLDLFVQLFDNVQAGVTRGPDGYLGWYGKALPLFQNPDDPDRKVDVMINSFRAVEILSSFIELIDRDPALKQRFEKQRAEYLDLMQNHLVEKWHARGNYVDLGGEGAIYRTHAGLKADKAHLTQPANKLSIITHGLLALYRVTGDDRYMERAVKVGTWFKGRLSLDDGAYTWNYWAPAGEWDIHPERPNQWKHWIGAEHRAGYYSHSVGLAVELYHHGVVFSEQDIARFLKTQMQRAWNGDEENPQYRRVDGSDGPQSGSYLAGSLAPFDERLARFIYGERGTSARLESASHPWQGGPAANGWIYGKFISLPKAEGGRRVHAEHGERFRGKPDNRMLLEVLGFEVEGNGYEPPRRPSDWRQDTIRTATP